MSDYKKIFEKIVENLKAKKVEDIDNVINAFNVAEKLHSGQKRQSGEDYILHPVCVAKILEKQDFDTNVISAGLLHDTVEDCGYTLDQITNSFNAEISAIVDAVSAITSKNLNPEMRELLSKNEFAKFDLKEMSYQKLISLGKINRAAFYIKFADRINNLQTIGCFPRYKQVDKVKETEKWLLPLLKLFKANSFYHIISNECFLITNEENLSKFSEIYDNYFKINENYNKKLKEMLLFEISGLLMRSHIKASLQKVHIQNATHKEVFDQINKLFGVTELKMVKQSQFNKLANTKLFLVFDNKLSSSELKSFVLNMFDGEFKGVLKIIGYDKDELSGENYLIVEDIHRNKFQFYVFTLSEYTMFRNGTTEGTDVEYIDENALTEVVTKYIRVKTRSGEVIALPEGSTVLDFAFKIHKDFGFSVEYAFLNKSPAKSPIYTRLSEGDQINLEIAKDENGMCKNIAELRWIAYAKTESAQKSLIHYFEKRLIM